LLLHWPVGGYRWKANSQARFLRHYEFAKQNGLTAWLGAPGQEISGMTRKPVLAGDDRARKNSLTASPARIWNIT
jgi:hypothetical protein